MMGCELALPYSVGQPPAESLTSSESDESSQCSSVDTGKAWDTVTLEDGSDSSDGGTEPGPER